MLRWKFSHDFDGVGPRCPWYRDPYTAEPYGCSAGDESRNRQSCPIFMPGHSLMGKRRDVRQLEGHVPREPGIDEARSGMSEEAKPSQTRLSFEPSGNVVRKRDHFVRRCQHELAWMEDERLVAVRLDQASQVRLLDRGVDVRVPMILEHPEEPIESYVNTGRLDHLDVVRLETHPPSLDLGPDVAI